MNKTRIASVGFTIVELLIVIVVIGILAAITLVSYVGISERAVTASIQSDLAENSKKLKLYHTLYDSYPTALDVNDCPTAPNADTNYCLISSSGSTLSYESIASSTFHLTSTKDNVSYSVTNSTAPSVATTTSGSSVGQSCPTGFIPVPGSGTYGTDDFCVMKYEAKDVSGTATSVAAGTPWSGISQTDAITQSAAACSEGCHLITENEWMTITQNVLSVASNWSGGTVGSGYIYSGHNDNAPASTLAATTNDADGYYGETNTGGDQRRTLTLTNGEVIWDFAGNVWESTQGVIGANQQPGLLGESAYAWKQWNDTSLLQHELPDIAMPANIDISGSGSWSSTQRIGKLYSKYTETVAHSYIRGGSYSISTGAGVLSLRLLYSPTGTSGDLGFRVTK